MDKATNILCLKIGTGFVLIFLLAIVALMNFPRHSLAEYISVIVFAISWIGAFVFFFVLGLGPILHTIGFNNEDLEGQAKMKKGLLSCLIIHEESRGD